MKFKLIKEFADPVRCYNGEMIKTGDVITLSGHLAQKARNNPNYAEVRAKKSKGEIDLSDGVSDEEANLAGRALAAKKKSK